jgi:polyisoprenoid-binding protein YceI
MKYILLSASIFSLAFVYTNLQPVKADMAITTTPQPVSSTFGKSYKLDTAKSSLGWTGSKPTGKHNGSIKITEGNIEVSDNKVVSGSFMIDMKSITNLDMQGSKGQKGLEGHLKSPDFFDVEKFPTAKFDITGCVPFAAGEKTILEGATHMLSGNLELKGVVKNISFPAVVKMDGSAVTASSDFNIDRTLWDITYGSDGKVAKEINLKLTITANK